ncbi:MAG: sel1 repeat family protein [Bacteroidales bacterium]|nr:sel1 repeat family protein [Bacteroidales bacterium]
MKKFVAILVAMVMAVMNVMGQVVTATVHEEYDLPTTEDIEEAKNNKNADALLEYGNIFQEAMQVEDMAKCYKAAADLGSVEGMYQTGICYLYGTGVKANAQQGVVWLKKAVAKGYDDEYGLLAYELGKCYQDGVGVTKNYNEALKWYRKGKDKGDESCEFGEKYILAVQGKDGKKLFEMGNGWLSSNDPDRREKAFHCFKMAAEFGNSEAQFMTGRCYDEGFGVPKDSKQAASWFKKAATQGHSGAQNKLGICYCEGVGVEKNESECVKWIKKAAENGNAHGQYNLAVWYYNGEHVEKNYNESLKWAQKSAEQGNNLAQYLTGIFYEYAFGVPKDLAKAKEWYQKSAEQGCEEAKKGLARISSAEPYKMTRIVSSHLKLSKDVILINKTNYTLGKVSVTKNGIELFTKTNATPNSEEIVRKTDKKILSQLLGETITITIECDAARKAKILLDVAIEEQSHNFVVRVFANGH